MRLNALTSSLFSFRQPPVSYFKPLPEYRPNIRTVEFQLLEYSARTENGAMISGTVVNCVRLLTFGWNQIEHRFGSQRLVFNVYIGEDGTVEYHNHPTYDKDQWAVVSLRYRVSYTVHGGRFNHFGSRHLESPRNIWERPHIEIRR